MLIYFPCPLCREENLIVALIIMSHTGNILCPQETPVKDRNKLINDKTLGRASKQVVILYLLRCECRLIPEKGTGFSFIFRLL